MERHLKKKLPGGCFSDVSSTRSRIMSSIRGKSNKSTEAVLRSKIVRAGISGWTMHPPNVPGKPDFYFYRQNIAIFVDGCFWHGCGRCGHIPKTRTAFWSAKILRNRQRDRRTRSTLRRRGIRVISFWEHQLLRTSGDSILTKLMNALEKMSAQ